ncbi:uncharacterized protein LOC144009828 [Festucalex cinctus]
MNEAQVGGQEEEIAATSCSSRCANLENSSWCEPEGSSFHNTLLLHMHTQHSRLNENMSRSYEMHACVLTTLPWQQLLLELTMRGRSLRRNNDYRRQWHGGELLPPHALTKLQQKALQQPKQKKSKSAEFLMARGGDAVGIENENPSLPTEEEALELSLLPVRLPREIRGNEYARNDFDPTSAERTDSRRRSVAAVRGQDELELSTPFAVVIVLPGSLKRGTAVASGDEEVLEVKAGNPVVLHGGCDGAASGSEPSQAGAIAKTQAGPSTGHSREDGGPAARTVMGKESTVEIKTSEEAVPRHAGLPRERVRPDMITLGSLSLQQHAAVKAPLKTSEWAKMKRRLMNVFNGGVKDAHPKRYRENAVRTQSRLNAIAHCSSNTPESLSHREVGEGQEAMSKYGQMMQLPESSSSVPRCQMYPSTTPQPVEVCVRCLRATRDKLARGLYSVSVALQSHLGGPCLPWRNDKGQQEWMASTEPVENQGCYYNVNLHVNQNLFMILPPACEILPSAVLIFRLTASPGQSGYVKSVLAWGAFPVCGPSLGLVEGRYKTPLLRGEASTQLDQFQKIEALISSDLDHWLCNMYFQIRRLPLGASACPNTLQTPPLNTHVTLQPAVQHGQLPTRAPSGSRHDPQPNHPQLSLNLRHAGPSSGAGEPAAVRSPRGSPLHLSADSACSSSSLPGKDPSPGDISVNVGAKSQARREKDEGGIHFKKKPIKKTNSRGPSVSGGSAGKRRTRPSVRNLHAEEMEEYTFSVLSS